MNSHALFCPLQSTQYEILILLFHKTFSPHLTAFPHSQFNNILGWERQINCITFLIIWCSEAQYRVFCCGVYRLRTHINTFRCDITNWWRNDIPWRVMWTTFGRMAHSCKCFNRNLDAAVVVADFLLFEVLTCRIATNSTRLYHILIFCCAYSCTPYGLHTQYILLSDTVSFGVYSCTQWDFHTQYILLPDAVSFCAYSCTQ